MIKHELAGKVTFPVYIDCVYQQGRYDEHGVARHGYAADAPIIETPRDAREHYRKRFGIESSYHQAIRSTILQNSTNDHSKRRRPPRRAPPRTASVDNA